jgi:hypothetical protein
MANQNLFLLRVLQPKNTMYETHMVFELYLIVLANNPFGNYCTIVNKKLSINSLTQPSPPLSVNLTSTAS